MEGTKNFYNEMIEEIKFHEAEAKKLKEDGKLAEVSGLYDYAIGLHDGISMAIKMVLHKIYLTCELDKDLKQGISPAKERIYEEKNIQEFLFGNGHFARCEALHKKRVREVDKKSV